MRLWTTAAFLTLLASLSILSCGRFRKIPQRRDKPGTPASAHRPVATACPRERVAGNAEPAAPGECSKDSDCKTGQNGRCSRSFERRVTNRCEYDACVVDSDCHAGGPCVCKGCPSDPSCVDDSQCLCGLLGVNGSNRCAAGNCRTDGECGPHGFCSPSRPVRGGELSDGWFCHTDADECTNDEDCKKASTPGKEAICGYSSSKSRWVCDHHRYAT